uniref:Uncharacterized protein n=1 Tax=Anguilla anguilla TaxID=7936 RepID=A0A0E9T8V2_ANGAN
MGFYFCHNKSFSRLKPLLLSGWINYVMLL